MKAKRVTSIEAFDAIVNEAFADKAAKVFVLFFGTETAPPDQGGESWCPDCVIADPLVRDAVAKVDHSVLLEVPVGTREEWRKGSENPYRQRFGLTSIPTLFQWQPDNTPGNRLEEADCADRTKLATFIGI